MIMRICLDLNIWVGNFLAEKAGRKGTAAQELVGIAREGFCSIGPAQLVISWAMLSGLEDVLKREFEVHEATAQQLTQLIASFAVLGPSGDAPYIVLGTGVIPLRDAEDAGVLDTAISGRADVLVTRNLKDFIGPDATEVIPGQYAQYWRADSFGQAGHRIRIVDPSLMMSWLRNGRLP